MKSLLDVKPNIQLKIIAIEGGKEVRKRLSALGIGVGSFVTILRNAPFSGPIVLEHNGSRTVIGKGIASKIQVTIVE